jgi:hypothetical protein
MIQSSRLFEHRAPVHLLIFATAAVVVPWLSLALCQTLDEGTPRDLTTALCLLFLPLGLSVLTILLARKLSMPVMMSVFAVLILAGAAVVNLVCATLPCRSWRILIWSIRWPESATDAIGLPVVADDARSYSVPYTHWSILKYQHWILSLMFRRYQGAFRG